MKSIEVKNLTKVFIVVKRTATLSLVKKTFNNSKLKALDNITFSVEEGEMIGIIGRNGSGKTTLLRMIAGIYQPDGGSVSVRGKLAPVLQIGTGFNKELDAKENVMLYGLLLGLSKNEINKKFSKIVEFAELDRFSNMKLKHYSTGMRARLAFSTALEIDPDILLVDEILSVGDQSFKEKSFEAFLKFKEMKKTILYTSHNVKKMPTLCDRVLLLDHGRLIAIGNPKETIEKYQHLLNTQEI